MFSFGSSILALNNKAPKKRNWESLKIITRSKTRIEILAGRLKKLPCKMCGTEDVDAHHEDYSKPLDVLFLCKSHHGERHRNEHLEVFSFVRTGL